MTGNEDVGQAMLEAAASAPSVHNTQPWHLTLTAAGLEVRADWSRQLHALDPTGRQLVMSCGAAVDHAAVTAAALGHGVAVAEVPDPEQPDLLAVVSVTGEALVSPDAAALAEAIRRRHTYRDRFLDEPVPVDVLEALARAARDAGAWLDVVSNEDRLLQVEVLLTHATEEQVRNPEYVAELAFWTEQPAETGFGIPAANRDPAAGAGSNVAVRDFSAGQGTSPLAADEPPQVDHPSVVVLGTDGDDVRAQVQAGRALSRVLLTATAHGLAAQPLGQVTDTVAWRSRLTAVLALRGHAQLVLRVGWPQHDVPATPRKPT